MNDNSAGDTSHGSGKAPAVLYPEVLDIDEQISRLASKGVDVSDYDSARKLLSGAGYARIMRYVRVMSRLDNKVPSVPRLLAAVRLESIFQRIALSHIVAFERGFKSKLAASLGSEYGPFAHLTADPFDCVRNFESFRKACERENGRRMNKRSAFLRRHRSPDGEYPIWIQLEIIPFGTVSLLYSDLRAGIARSGVSSAYGIDHAILQSWLRALVVLRNICAHGGVLYGRQLEQIPRAIQEFGDLDLRHAAGCVHVLLYMQRVADPSASLRLVNDLAANFLRMDVGLLKPLGFGDGWFRLLQKVALDTRSPLTVIASEALSLGRVA